LPHGKLLSGENGKLFDVPQSLCHQKGLCISTLPLDPRLEKVPRNGICSCPGELLARRGEAKKSREDSENKEEQGSVFAFHEEEQAYGTGY
jgi:hypothetical protein